MVQEHFTDEVLLAYQDGELAREVRARVQGHLDQCWKCRASLAALEQQAHELAELFEESSFPDPRALVETKLTLLRRVSQYENVLQRQAVVGDSWWHGRRVQMTAFLALLAMIGFGMWQHRRPPVVLAAPLLQRSISAERLPMRQPHQVVHRTLRLEERVPALGKVLARRRIEVWEGQPSSSAGIKARRIYDEQGNLVSGDWRFRSGSRRLYQRGSPPQKTFLPKEDVLRVPQSIEAAWRLDLCAKDFATLIGDPSQAVVKETASSHVVTYDRPPLVSEESSSKLIKAWLVLNKSDLRAIEQGLLVEQEKEEHEYRLTELHFDRYPRHMIATTVFQPELELLGPMDATKGTETSSRQLADPLPQTVSNLPPSVNAPLEVNVIYQLGQANMSLGDQALLQRLPDGSLLLNVTVEDEKQKNELLKALAPVLSDPLLHLELETASERSPSDVSALSELFPEISQSVLLSLKGDAKDDSVLNMEVGQTITRFIARSDRARTHAGALQTIGGRFSPDDLDRLDEDTRDKWLTMLLRHAQAFEYETLTLRQDLEAIFSYPSQGAEPTGEPVDGNNLQRVIQRLARLGANHDRIIREAFDSGGGKKEAAAVRAMGFHRSLQTAEKLAAAIRIAVAPE